MDENTRIMDMEITDEFFMVTEDERANTVAHSLQNLGEGGVVLVRQPSNEVVGYITEKEIVNSVATGFNPSDSTASQMMSTDFMEVMGDETLGNVLPLISEQYPNAIVVIDINRQCIGFFSKNDYKDALAGLGCYDKSHEPTTPDEWRTQGIAMSSMGNTEDALICYENSLALYNDKERGWFEMARNFEMSNRLKDAILCYDRVVSMNPNNDDAWINRGNVYAVLRNPNQAIQSYTRALDLNPDNPDALINMGLALSDVGNIDRAISCYDQIEAYKGESPELWYRKGNVYDKDKNYKESLKCYERAIELNPNYEEAWFNKGATLHTMGKDKKAVECFEAVLKINPNNESAKDALEICKDNKGFTFFG
jgi:tetratricopeptide (TPR) repeat protein